MNRLDQLREKSFDKAEWQKLFYKYQQEYVRRRLEAIKYLHEGKTRKEVIEKINCARQSLISWIDMYCEGGLEALTKLTKSNRTQRLDSEKKAEIKKMLLEQKPTDYGIDRQIWTGKIIVEIVYTRWGIEIKDSRIYDILKEMKLSHQKAHRDYENGDYKSQQEFVATVKKNRRTETYREASIL